MNKKEFSKWLEKVEKDISSKEIILEDLQLSANKSQVSSILSQVDQTTKVPTKGKKPFKTSLSSSSFAKPDNQFRLTSSKSKPANMPEPKNPIKSLNPSNSVKPGESSIFNFKPEISKNSQEIAKKLGPSSSRLMAPKVRSSLDSMTISENPLMFNSLTSVNPLSTFNSAQGLNSMNSFNLFNSCNSFTSFQSITSGVSLNQGPGTRQFSPSDPKGKTIKPEEFEVTAKRMFEWNRARLEKLRMNQEARLKQDLQVCTFRPEIREEKKGKTFENGKKTAETLKSSAKRPSKAKVGYSGKVAETTEEVSEKVKAFEDLDDSEYEHALKRLHWELESIVLNE